MTSLSPWPGNAAAGRVERGRDVAWLDWAGVDNVRMGLNGSEWLLGALQMAPSARCDSLFSPERVAATCGQIFFLSRPPLAELCLRRSSNHADHPPHTEGALDCPCSCLGGRQQSPIPSVLKYHLLMEHSIRHLHRHGHCLHLYILLLEVLYPSSLRTITTLTTPTKSNHAAKLR